MRLQTLIIVATLSFIGPFTLAQTASAPVPSPRPLVGSIASNPAWPAAKNPADVDTVEHILASLYNVISGPAGQPRDWDRFRSLFLPDGRLGVIRPERAANAGQPAQPGDVILLSPNTYIERDDPYFKKEGFFEHGIHNNIEEFGNLVSVWSTYESRHAPNDAKPFARGINSIQLVHAQGRYWIASILWADERPGLTLPSKYLPK